LFFFEAVSLTRHEQSAPTLGGTPEQTPGGFDKGDVLMEQEGTSAGYLADS